MSTMAANPHTNRTSQIEAGILAELNRLGEASSAALIEHFRRTASAHDTREAIWRLISENKVEMTADQNLRIFVPKREAAS